MDSPAQYGKQTDKARSLIFAGFIEAIIVASWLCDLPESSTLSWTKIFLTTAKYVVMPTLAAGVGAWTFQNLRANSSLSYNMLVTLAGTGWVLVTPTVLFYKQDSPWMMLSIAIAAVFTAISLRGLLPSDEIPSFANLKSAKAPASLLFMEPEYNGPNPWKALYLSLGFYAAVLAFCTGYLFTSGLLLAACVFAVAWSLILPPSSPPAMSVRKKQLAWVTALALLLTGYAVLPWMPLSHIPRADTSTKKAHSNNVSASERKLTGVSGFGYQGIVLWTMPQKKDTLPPAPNLFSMQNGQLAKPLVIPFDGAYWYFQAPNISPGRQAHVTKGDPLAVSIRSNDFLPLLMEAHQHLGAPIKLSCCRELKVDIRNGELHSGVIHLGVVLTDSLTPGKPSQYLGEQPILSSQSAHTHTDETVTFAIPSHPDIRSFDEITVLISPSSTWSTTGTKVAVQQFALTPR